MEKSRRLLVLVATMVLTLLTVAMIALPASAKPAPKPTPVIELKCANFFPITNELSVLLGKFCDDMGKRSEGRVKITYHPGAVLLGPTNMFDGVLGGIADIGHCHIGYSPRRFPVLELFTGPGGYPDVWIGSHVVNDFYNKYHPKEWDNVHILWLFSAGGGGLINRTKLIRVMEDTKGLTFRTTGRAAEAAKLLGITPRDLAYADCYEAMHRGTIDGIEITLESAKGWRFSEVGKYLTYAPAMSTALPFYVIMNKDKWNSLPKDIQKIFDEVCKEYREKFAIRYNEMCVEGVAYHKSLPGNEYYQLPPAEDTRWTATIAPIFEKYVKDKVALGYAEADVREWIKFAREQTKYWIEQEKKAGIVTYWTR